MARYFFSVVVTACALWIVTSIMSGLDVVPFAAGTLGIQPPWNTVLTYAVIAAVYGLIQSTVGRVVKFVSIPLTVLTFGIVLLFINGWLLWLTTIVSGWLGWGLSATSFWSTLWGAFWITIVNAILLGISRVGSRAVRS